MRAKDTPNFIANRIGIFSVLATMRHTRDATGCGFDVVDALTGPAIGRREERDLPHRRRRRPRHDGARRQDDAGHAARRSLASRCSRRRRRSPALMAKGALGQKTKAGLLPQGRQGHRGARSGVAAPTREPAPGSRPRSPKSWRSRIPRERFAAAARESSHPQAQFLWAIFRDLFHYAAHHLAAIADNARDVDLAIRWGFGWQHGPVRDSGRRPAGSDVAGWIADDIARGQGRSPTSPLPAWVGGKVVAAAGGVHAQGGAYSPAARRVRRALVAAGVSPPGVSRTPCSASVGPRDDDLRDRRAADVAPRATTSASCRSRPRRTPSATTCSTALQRAIDRAEREFAGLVIWQTREPFSLGANLAVARAGDRARASGSGIERDRRQASSRRRCACATASCRRSRPCAAWRWAGAANSSCTATARWRRSSRTSAWSRPASACSPAAAARKELALRAADEVRRGRDRRPARPVPVPAHVLPDRRDGHGVEERAARRKELGFLRPADVVVMQSGRGAARRAGAGARAGGSRLPAAAAAAQRFRSPAGPASRRWR